MRETFLVFTFGERAAARQACKQIEKWVEAFHIAYGQLAARHDADDNRVYIRLKFEAHEVNAYSRWLERLRGEPLFAQAEGKMFVEGAEGFAAIREHFERLQEAD